MQKASLDELRGQIAAGQYAVDSRALAGDILAKFELIRRVSRGLVAEAEEDVGGEAGLITASRRRRGARPASPQSRNPRSERLP